MWSSSCSAYVETQNVAQRRPPIELGTGVVKGKVDIVRQMTMEGEPCGKALGWVSRVMLVVGVDNRSGRGQQSVGRERRREADATELGV